MQRAAKHILFDPTIKRLACKRPAVRIGCICIPGLPL
jgi:hypothetical protein